MPGKARCHVCGGYTSVDVVGQSAGEDDFVDITAVEATKFERIVTGGPWDKAWGGGFVPSTTTIVVGPPGGGKTTLLLQLAALFAELRKKPAYYVSAEQDKGELKFTVDRLALNLQFGMLRVLKKMGVGGELDTAMLDKNPPSMIILDSVTALCGKDRDLQVLVARKYKGYAVKYMAPVFLINHMNKEGDAAGLLTLQHDCDTLMGLWPSDNERSKFYGHPALEPYKNRFGATRFEVQLLMTEHGLVGVPEEKSKKKQARAPDEPISLPRADLPPPPPPMSKDDRPREPSAAERARATAKKRAAAPGQTRVTSKELRARKQARAAAAVEKKRRAPKKSEKRRQSGGRRASA